MEVKIGSPNQTPAIIDNLTGIEAFSIESNPSLLIGGPLNVDLSQLSLPEAQLLGISQIRLIGGGDTDNLLGSGINDFIDGKGGDDLLNGKGGDDTILGGLGNDTLLGANGNDNISGGDGNDSINGGARKRRAVRR